MNTIMISLHKQQFKFFDQLRVSLYIEFSYSAKTSVYKEKYVVI